ncbi:MAG: iron chelate uptake ABC transporter family permease subunit [Planctomycetota bacterium]
MILNGASTVRAWRLAGWILFGGVLATLGGCAGEPSDTTDSWGRVLLMRDYNTRVVVLGVAMLGGAAGLVGSFMLLRKRALLGDALAHASLPGIAIAFLVAVAAGLDEKSITVLSIGATLSGLAGVALILFIRSQTRIKEDAAMGIVLSVFFGAGVALLGIIQKMDKGHAAGLEEFIYGKTASMVADDARGIAYVSLLALIVCVLLYKELKLLCFDEGFASSRGYPTMGLDIVLMSMVVLVTIVGLQAVGIILMIALLVIPAAASRFWTDSMSPMALVAAGLGALGSAIGGLVSALAPGLPSGAMIVLACAGFFFISLFFGTRRGIIVRWIRRVQLARRIDRQHLLRAMLECIEQTTPSSSDRAEHHALDLSPLRKTPISIEQLLAMRSWSEKRLRLTIDRAVDHDLVRAKESQCTLTQAGFYEAARLTRQHRLWEMYLITHAEIATSNVDRDADAIEHVLQPEIVDQLEELLDSNGMTIVVPPCPHESSPGSQHVSAAGGTA